jgi:hypothetical protein
MGSECITFPTVNIYIRILIIHKCVGFVSCTGSFGMIPAERFLKCLYFVLAPYLVSMMMIIIIIIIIRLIIILCKFHIVHLGYVSFVP